MALGSALNAQVKKEISIYTIAVNIVSESFDFPLVGFFANGEISNHRLYSYTGVLALFL